MQTNTSTLALNDIQRRTIDLVDGMASYIAAVQAGLDRPGLEAEPSPEDWKAVELQLYAVPELQRGLAALARITGITVINSRRQVDPRTHPIDQ